MFFALCVPSVAYGDCGNITNSSELSSGNEVAETNTTESSESGSSVETPEFSDPTETETKDPGITDEESIVSDEQKESFLDEPNVVEPIEEIPVKEETQPNEELKVLPQTQVTEQIILTSVEGLPSEAIIEFTLDGVRVGLVSDGIITDALPILATDKQRVKACITNKVRIVGAKIKFDTYKSAEQLPIIMQPIVPPETIKPVEVEQEKPEDPIVEGPVETEDPIEEEPATELDNGNIDEDIEEDISEGEDNEGTIEDGNADGVIEDNENIPDEGIIEDDNADGIVEDNENIPDEDSGNIIEGNEGIVGDDNADGTLVGRIDNGIVTYAVDFVPVNVFVTITGRPGTEFNIVFTFDTEPEEILAESILEYLPGIPSISMEDEKRLN